MEPNGDVHDRRSYEEEYEDRQYPRRRRGRGLAMVVASALLVVALLAAAAVLVTPFILHFEGDSKVWPYDESELRIVVLDDNSGGDAVVLYKQLTTDYQIPINETFWSKSGSDETMDHVLRRVLKEVEEVTGLDLEGDAAVEKDNVEIRGVVRGVRVQNRFGLEACTDYDFEAPKWCKEYESGSFDEADLQAAGHDLDDCEPHSSIELRLRKWDTMLRPDGYVDSRSQIEIRSIDEDQRDSMARPFEPTYQLADECTYNIEEDVFYDCLRRYTAMAFIDTLSEVEISTCKDIMRFFPGCFDKADAPFDSSKKNNAVVQKGDGGHVLWQDIRAVLDKRNGIQFQFILSVEYETVDLAVEEIKPSREGDITFRIFAPRGGLGPWEGYLSVITENWYTRLLASFGADGALPC